MDLNVLLLGRHEYGDALRIQNELLGKRQRGEIGDTLILVEHDPVITLGKNAVKENITASEEYLKDNGISVHSINRGGDVTYHGYGQIVGYPIINLRLKEMGVKKFVDTLEELFIRLLKEKYGIAAGRDEHHTGVWVNNDKILAIGLAVKRQVTMHGFAFNVSTNLEHFNNIVPCGIKEKGVTSLKKLLGKDFPDAGTECESIISYFCSLFSYENCKMVKLEDILNQEV
jgi:lipoyl(octanoyl) transferase